MGYSLTLAILAVFGIYLFCSFWAYTIYPMLPRFEVLLAVYPTSWVITETAALIACFGMSRRAFVCLTPQRP